MMVLAERNCDEKVNMCTTSVRTVMLVIQYSSVPIRRFTNEPTPGGTLPVQLPGVIMNDTMKGRGQTHVPCSNRRSNCR